MQISIKKGFSFGLISGIITTLGLIIGLHSSTHSKIVIIGGILVIAIADALSDALGIHISEESENQHSAKDIWMATIATFISKLIVALTFVVPILLFSLPAAIFISVMWGLLLIAVFSFYMAKQQQQINPCKVIAEHLTIAILVIIITHYIGDWVRTLG